MTTMPLWAYAVVFCVVLVGIGYVVDRRSRAIRAGLVVPADSQGRHSADGAARARLGPGGASRLGDIGGGAGYTGLGGGVG